MVIIGAIIIVVFIFALIGVGSHLSDKWGSGFSVGIFIGVVITIFIVIEICLVSRIIEKPKPTAMDVYKGKTTLEITYKNGVPIDSTVVWESK